MGWPIRVWRVMADSQQIEVCRLLIVSDGQDESIRWCSERVRQAGVRVQCVPDVYAAMALLAQGAAISHVLVDVRQLDQEEMRFLEVAPRYGGGAEFFVPRLGDINENRAGYGRRVSIVEIGDLAAAILGLRDAVTPEQGDDMEVVEWAEPAGERPQIAEPAEEWLPTSTPVDAPTGSDPPQRSPRSIEGGLDETEGGPSLHEAVRERMGGGGAIPLRRTPPPAKPATEDPAAAQPAEWAASQNRELTREEVEALLRDDDAHGGETDDAHEGETGIVP